MTTLEATLIKSAELELQMFVSFIHDGSKQEQANCYQRLSALTVFAYIVNSGLSDAGIAKLEEIDNASTDLFKRNPA